MKDPFGGHSAIIPTTLITAMAARRHLLHASDALTIRNMCVLYKLCYLPKCVFIFHFAYAKDSYIAYMKDTSSLEAHRAI